MGLEHRGNRFTEDEDIIRLLDAKEAAEGVPDASYASGIISSRVSQFANRSYVDSVFDGYATQADVDSAYSTKLPKSALGSSLLQVGEDGRFSPSQLPSVTTRGAQWVDCGTFNVMGETVEVDTGGWLNSSTTLANRTVYGSWMGNRPYHVLGFAQAEVKHLYTNSNPILYIATSTLSGATNISVGHGIPGHMDYYHITAVPASSSNTSTTNFTGNNTFYLTARDYTSNSTFGRFMGCWGLLLIPVT